MSKIKQLLEEFDKQIKKREDFIKTDKGTDRTRREMIEEIETLTRNKFYVQKGVNVAIDEVLKLIEDAPRLDSGDGEYLMGWNRIKSLIEELKGK